MAQYITGTVSVVNGDATVTGTGTSWLTEAAAGDGFTIVDSGVSYTVGSVTDDTHLELTGNYTGSTESGLSYAIFRDFTSPDSIPELNKGDIETPAIWTRAVRKIQDLVVSLRALATTSSVTHNFTVNGDYTLTAAQEEYGRIVLTDTTPVLTTARNVIVSTTARGHWFVNSTAQTLTIKTSAGTGKALYAGDSLYLICDGTNIVAGNSRTDVTTAGVAQAFKALVLGTNKNVDTLVIADGGLKLGSGSGTAVTSTASELNFNDGSVAGTAVASKTLVLGSNKNVDTLVIADGGLKLGSGAGTAVTATATELNYNDITTLGTVQASKTVTADSNKDITGARTVSADNFVPSTPFNFRNKLINGNFDFWYYATSQTSSGYGSDNRWTNVHTGSTKTHSRQTFTLGQTDVPGNPTYFSRTVVTSVAGASNRVIKVQKIEKVSTLAGKTATLTFYAKADASKNIAIEFLQDFGTGGSPSSSVDTIGVTTCALTTSWQKFTVTVSIPSISTKTLGTDNNDSLYCTFWFDAGSSFNSRTNSLGQQSGTFDIASVQLEEGSVATPFEQRPLGIERELCQRYFSPLYFRVRGYNTAGNSIGHFLPFNTTMRAIPTIDFGTVTYANSSGITAENTSTIGTAFYITVTASGSATAVTTTATADAEL